MSPVVDEGFEDEYEDDMGYEEEPEDDLRRIFEYYAAYGEPLPTAELHASKVRYASRGSDNGLAS